MAHKPLPCPLKISCQVDVVVPDLIMQLQHDKLKVSYGSAFGEGFPSASTTAFLLLASFFSEPDECSGIRGGPDGLLHGIGYSLPLCIMSSGSTTRR